MQFKGLFRTIMLLCVVGLAEWSLPGLPVLAQTSTDDISVNLHFPIVAPFAEEQAPATGAYNALVKARTRLVPVQPPLPGFTRFGGEFSAGLAAPSGVLRDSGAFKQAFFIGGSFHFRPHRAPRLQFDLIGLDMAFDAIRTDRRVPLTTGELRDLYDLEVFINSGARFYLTDPLKPTQVSLGGGATFARYGEFPEEGEFEQINCTVCESRWGRGGYVMGQVRQRLSPRFGLGFTTKYYIVRTKGDALFGNLPLRTTDRWLMFAATLSLN